MEKPTLIIKKESFLEWYFDKDTLRETGNDVFLALKETEEYTITLQSMWKGLGYISKDHEMIKNPEIIKEEHINKHDEIDEPSQDYNARFIEED